MYEIFFACIFSLLSSDSWRTRELAYQGLIVLNNQCDLREYLIKYSDNAKSLEARSRGEAILNQYYNLDMNVEGLAIIYYNGVGDQAWEREFHRTHYKLWFGHRFVWQKFQFFNQEYGDLHEEALKNFLQRKMREGASRQWVLTVLNKIKINYKNGTKYEPKIERPELWKVLLSRFLWL